MSKMDEHVARPESVEFDTRAQITVKHSLVIQWNKVEPEVRQSHKQFHRSAFKCRLPSKHGCRLAMVTL